MVFYHFEWFERVCMSCCHSRALENMLQICHFRGSSGAVDFKAISWGSLCKNRAVAMYMLDILWYLSWFLIIFSHLRAFTLSCSHSRALQDMLQIAISEGPVDFKIGSPGLLWTNKASLLHLLDILRYLVWFLLTILSDKLSFNRSVAMGKQTLLRSFQAWNFTKPDSLLRLILAQWH